MAALSAGAGTVLPRRLTAGFHHFCPAALGPQLPAYCPEEMEAGAQNMPLVRSVVEGPADGGQSSVAEAPGLQKVDRCAHGGGHLSSIWVI